MLPTFPAAPPTPQPTPQPTMRHTIDGTGAQRPLNKSRGFHCADAHAPPVYGVALCITTVTAGRLLGWGGIAFPCLGRPSNSSTCNPCGRLAALQCTCSAGNQKLPAVGFLRTCRAFSMGATGAAGAGVLLLGMASCFLTGASSASCKMPCGVCTCRVEAAAAHAASRLAACGCRFLPISQWLRIAPIRPQSGWRGREAAARVGGGLRRL